MELADILAAGRRRETVTLQLAAGEAVFVFEALPARGSGSWSELRSNFPATTEQVEDGLAIDIESWVVAAVAASCVDPKMTVAQVTQLADEVLNDTEWAALWGACANANIGVNRPESSAASAPTARTRPNSKRRSGSGGRAPSS